MQRQRLFKALLPLMLLLSAVPLSAQQHSLSGRVIDAESREAMVKTTLQLYKIGRRDTTFVNGTYSDQQGRFAFSGVGEGNYLLRISYLGYKTQSRPVTKRGDRALALGDITLETDAVQLK